MSQESIEELGIGPKDIWFIKIDGDINGPYERLALKHFSHENEELFYHAEASQDQTHWQSFFDVEFFKKAEVSKQHQGPFWILVDNHKSHPLNRLDIIKKIESSELSLMDAVSFDDGYTWKKLHQCEELKSYFQKKMKPPVCPSEAHFQGTKIENHDHDIEENVASMAYVRNHQVANNGLKLDEMVLPSQNNIEVSAGLKWMIPTSVAAICLVAYGSFYILKPAKSPLVSQDEQVRAIENYNEKSGPTQMRQPASIPTPAHGERSALTQRPQMPENMYPANEPEPMAPVEDYPSEPIVESHQAPEETLVQNEAQDQGIDASMNAMPPEQTEPQQSEQPVVEEASDF